MIRQHKNYKSFIDNVVKLLQGRKVRYISAKTGNAYNTVEEAVKDNTKYVKDPNYRYLIKEQKVRKPKEYNIPFIKDKKVILTNAGLASGAVLSTNMLDTIAKHAEAAGLPINIAIALSAKESTLGNPTFDKSIYKILNPQRRKIYEWFKNGQHINNGNDIPERELINWTRDELGPYGLTMSYLDTKRKTQELYNAALEASEKYDDGRVKDYEDTYADNNVLFNGFKFYKEHPDLYNPGLPNYLELVNQRAKEIWQSPEIQEWYKQYLTNKKIKSLKQGGKMNIIDFLKKGSGIHIKKENRGKFTDYCGGKVTSACIAKGKASSNPVIRKRATFAANARKWKHRSGGLLGHTSKVDYEVRLEEVAGFKNGGNLKFLLQGGNTANLLSGITSTAMNAYSAIQAQKAANLKIESLDKSLEFNQKDLLNKYLLEELEKINNETLPDGVHASPIYNRYIAELRALKRVLADLLKIKFLNELDKANILSEATLKTNDAIAGGLLTLGGIAINYFTNKSSNKNASPASTSYVLPK